MAGEEIKPPLGANEYDHEGRLNPLYYRGIPREKWTPAVAPKSPEIERRELAYRTVFVTIVVVLTLCAMAIPTLGMLLLVSALV